MSRTSWTFASVMAVSVSRPAPACACAIMPGMSVEDVAVVRSIYELWGNGERAGHLIDPELEYVNPEYAIEAGTSKGRGTLARIRDVYPDFRLEPERFGDAGESVVVIGLA